VPLIERGTVISKGPFTLKALKIYAVEFVKVNLVVPSIPKRFEEDEFNVELSALNSPCASFVKPVRCP